MPVGRGHARDVATACRGASRRAPRLLAVEDLHWADRATLEHLAELAAAVSALSRAPSSDIAQRGRSARRGMAARDCRRPAHDDRSRPAAARRSALLWRPASSMPQSGSSSNAWTGPPVTRCSSNSSCGMPRKAPASGVPGSVQNLVQARIDRLDPGDKLALQAASVLGQRFGRGALRHLVGRPTTSLTDWSRIISSAGRRTDFCSRTP